jgi:hypothetical protein
MDRLPQYEPGWVVENNDTNIQGWTETALRIMERGCSESFVFKH